MAQRNGIPDSQVLLRNCFFIQPSADKEGVRGQDILIEGNLIAGSGRGSRRPPARASLIARATSWFPDS